MRIQRIINFVLLFIISINILCNAVELFIEKKIKLEQKDIILSKLICASADKDGNIYLIDMTPIKMLKYDKKGKFIEVLVKKGEGPDEISFVINIAIDDLNSRLITLDIQKNSLLLIDMGGNFIKQISLPGYHYSVNVNLFSEIFIVNRPSKGQPIISKLDKEYQETIKFFKYSGKGDFRNLDMKGFLLDFDSAGNIYAAENLIYKINVFNRDGEPVRTFGKPGRDFRPFKTNPPLISTSVKFKKWQESFEALVNLTVVNDKYCVVFYRTAMKRDAIIHYDIYSLNGIKFDSGSLPQGMKPLQGKGSNGNIYCSKEEISEDGTDVSFWLYEYTVR